MNIKTVDRLFLEMKKEVTKDKKNANWNKMMKKISTPKPKEYENLDLLKKDYFDLDKIDYDEFEDALLGMEDSGKITFKQRKDAQDKAK
jgi:predicted nuclease of restriction endonuclease-like (RecB) superfamily